MVVMVTDVAEIKGGLVESIVLILAAKWPNLHNPPFLVPLTANICYCLVQTDDDTIGSY